MQTVVWQKEVNEGANAETEAAHIIVSSDVQSLHPPSYMSRRLHADRFHLVLPTSRDYLGYVAL